MHGVTPGETRTIKVKGGSGDDTRTMSFAPAQQKKKKELVSLFENDFETRRQ
jgi:hypothetical protein